MPTPRDGIKPPSHGQVVAFPNLDNESIIREYFTYREQTRRWRPETFRLRRLQVRRLAEDLAPTTLHAATEDELISWHRSLRGMPETISSYTSGVRGLYQWMAVYSRPRLRTDDPTLILERPHIPDAQPRPMLDRHFDLALACAVSDPEMYLWLGLMGCSGLRCCEIAWMHTGDVEALDTGGGLLHITGKGGKERTVPAGEMVMLTMRPFLRGRGPVFTRADGQAHTPKAVSARTNRFLERIGVPAPQTAHSLRHRFGTDYHGIDPDLYRQAKLMGHASVDTTQRYTEISPLEAAKYIEQLTRRRLVAGRVWTPSSDARRAG